MGEQRVALQLLDDGDDTVYPGAVELCATATIDNNCDGNVADVDDNAADKIDFFADLDNDTFDIAVDATPRTARSATASIRTKTRSPPPTPISPSTASTRKTTPSSRPSSARTGALPLFRREGQDPAGFRATFHFPLAAPSVVVLS